MIVYRTVNKCLVLENCAYWLDVENFTVRAKVKDPYGAEGDWATLPVTVPYSYNVPTLLFWDQLFQQFPNAFPLLRQLLGY